jgi:hypothetical protein
MKPGDVINTNHGKARILGFERFNEKGFEAPYAPTLHKDERIICELLPGHTWCFEGLYCEFQHTYHELNH